MENLVKGLMTNYGYLAVFLLIFVENLFPPIPSEVILLFGGFMTTYAGLNLAIVILVSILGSICGAICLYYIGDKLGYSGVKKFFTGKAGKTLGLEPSDLTRTNAWFTKNGKKAVFLCRFVPLMRSLISIPAGIAKMPMAIFLLLTVIGTTIWNTVLTFLGRIAGNNWEKYSHLFDVYSKGFVIIMGIVSSIFILYKLYKRHKYLKNSKNDGMN